jgi:glycosyltransferase involved in cell wall biosynthesis
VKIVAALPNHHGSGYHRGLVPLRALAARGHAVRAEMSLDDPALLADADVLFLPIAQIETIYGHAARFQAGGGLVAYEFDDHYRATTASNPASKALRFGDRVGWMDRMLKLADVVTTSTPVLAETYRSDNPHIFVCRNSIDPLDVGPFFELGEPEPDGEIRIGFAGSVSHVDDIRLIVDPVVRLLDARPDVRFIMLGADFRTLFPQRLQAQLRYAGHTFYADDDGFVREYCYPGEVWPVVRYLQLLAKQRLHVAVAPLVDDVFNSGKSDLKLLEYGSLGIPTVASPAGPYRAYFRDAVAGPPFVPARESAEWEAALSELIASPGLRERYRSANRANVIAQRLISHEVEAWERALLSVTEASGRAH